MAVGGAVVSTWTTCACVVSTLPALSFDPNLTVVDEARLKGPV
jgi:hypothetical protein